MIYVCIPSRGLVHSRTMEDVLNALAWDGGFEYKINMAHGQPIPDCFNTVVALAMTEATDDDFIWIVEDDMGFHHSILDDLIYAGADIALADYPVRKLPTVKRDSKGEFMYGGLGCVLIKPWVFKALDKPWFSVEREYVEQDDTLVERPSKAHHGGQDVDFYQRVQKLTKPKVSKWDSPKPSIVVIDTPAVQYHLVKPELPRFGNHTAEEYKVEVWQLP